MSSPPLSTFDRFLEWFMYRFRWIFVIPILLPMSFTFNLYYAIRNWLIFNIQSAPKAHDRKVGLIQKQVRDWATGDRKAKMCTARPGWLTMSFRFPAYKAKMTQIRTDRLIDILEVDTTNHLIRVEPMVTMGQITRTLIPLGYTLPIVPELDDLTVGGMINGCGVESSGKRYGLFQHICHSYELVIADGSLVVASKEKKDGGSAESQALFYGVPWSHGTLGFLVAATLRIIPCKPYVKLTYIPTRTVKETQNTLIKECNDRENEFVEGLLFSKIKGLVMRGEFCDKPPRNGRQNEIGKWHKPWFYTHAEKLAEREEESVEYIPLRHYYHRHSRSIFWEIKEIVPFGNNLLFRWTLGWLCPPKISLLKVTTPPALRRLYERNHVIQDMLVPLETLQESVDVFEKEINIYPLWLCPFTLPSTPGMLRQRSGKNLLYIDIGAYGITMNKTYEPRESTRRLEEFVRKVNGVQMLYADTYMSRAEFWEMFDSSLYEWLRVKFGCKEAFPDVYDKVCKEARY
ncbi:unnamed protein product, partial [Mesorhabditis belari]|uniref:Delta(24)-sterol reductase n=1 Tax=Mesorhabditis belari TaxID=2138241 RepID=A0AAF3EUD7_9BILA